MVGIRADGTMVTIECQREDYEKLAAFCGWEVVETYVDQSISASDETKKHPAYLRMCRTTRLGLSTLSWSITSTVLYLSAPRTRGLDR